MVSFLFIMYRYFNIDVNLLCVTQVIALSYQKYVSGSVFDRAE